MLPHDAVRVTFGNRSTPIPDGVPPALSPNFADFPGKQAQWNAFIRKLQLDDPPDFRVVISFLADFLLPVFNAVANDTESSLTWPPGGLWG